jgi:hypothetical protein
MRGDETFDGAICVGAGLPHGDFVTHTNLTYLLWEGGQSVFARLKKKCKI